MSKDLHESFAKLTDFFYHNEQHLKGKITNVPLTLMIYVDKISDFVKITKSLGIGSIRNNSTDYDIKMSFGSVELLIYCPKRNLPIKPDPWKQLSELEEELATGQESI